ncbi:PhzF family phenazine biosynthesis protein [Jeongeupia wiesaeckerbachi]|uniref:PhzF family phenazine biosynthesis protein n=1 Tax=Jeongeupia wiesaeckerbachi TaxID=3051218 RepID=UPI003D805CC7
MRTLHYHVVNVFTAPDDNPFSGNALAVFPHADGVSDTRMQAIAQQLNLSETTFVRDCAGKAPGADADVRIFTPGYELPFAGHPTLGTAAVLDTERGLGGEVALHFPAGTVPVSIRDGLATLTAQSPRYRDAQGDATLARALGLSAERLAGRARFVDTGTEQLIVPVASADDVFACQPDVLLFSEVARSKQGRPQALVWAPSADGIIARFFWVQAGSIGEDFGTGSACANLGGWLLGQGQTLPFSSAMQQGHGIGRLAHLQLDLSADGAIRVSGRVRRIGYGTFELPDE